MIKHQTQSDTVPARMKRAIEAAKRHQNSNAEKQNGKLISSLEFAN